VVVWPFLDIIASNSSGGRQEFVEGLLKLKGPARAIDMAVLGRALVEAARFWFRWSGFS